MRRCARRHGRRPQRRGGGKWRSGPPENDLIGQRIDHNRTALGEIVSDGDVKHLIWLRQTIGDELVDAAVITTGDYGLRDADHAGVVGVRLSSPKVGRRRSDFPLV